MNRDEKKKRPGLATRYVPPAASLALFLAALVLVLLSTDHDAVSANPTGNSIRHIDLASLDATPLWTSSDRGLVMYAGRVGEDYWVCPHIENGSRQPFCRRFSGAVVAVCDREEEILIVLSDGDIHRVDYALIDADGKFLPAYHHPDDLELVDAWLPGSTCGNSVTLPEILALNRDSALLHFDRKTWRSLQ